MTSRILYNLLFIVTLRNLISVTFYISNYFLVINNAHLWPVHLLFIVRFCICVSVQSSTPLLDTSAQRSKADLGKRRIRTRPSRRLTAGLAQTETQDWGTQDSTGY